MSPHETRHAACTLWLVAIAVAIASAMAGPLWSADAKAEAWTISGKTYERVRVLEVTAGTVTIAHAGGMAQLDLGTLPAELQSRFQYDPERASTWKREAQSGLAATEALKQQEARDRKQRAELEEVRNRIAQRRAEVDPDHVELRPEVDLRPIFIQHNLYLKNQGARPSCSIFAVVSALEYEYARRFGVNDPLSEEYLIWAVQRSKPGTPLNDGYHFQEVLEVLRDCGVARRVLLPDSFAAYLKDGNPPIVALDDAVTRRAFNIVSIDPRDPGALLKFVAVLNQHTPVIIGIKWPPDSTLQRNNLLRDQAPQPGAGHAVTIVGYRSEGTPESLVFIYRNSYGPQWGLGGYGLMAGSYLQKHLLVAFCLIVPKANS